ncbi:MAG TPA: hypothetical protein VHI52_20175, partial [Verrucomicrobiae bacterium]|nr:hypothetical protein [Verrucomicrobiae bacterium]
MARATPKSSPGTLPQPAASVAQALPGRVHANQDSPRQPRCTFRSRLIRLGALALIGCWLPGPATAASLSEQARARYDEAQKADAAHPDNPEAGWKL